jgi:hypothetical protein
MVTGAEGAAIERNEDARVREAANAWASSRFGAPWRFHELITGVVDRDEAIRRLVTRVTCRTLREQRAPANERRTTWRAEVSRIVPADQLDPFAHTTDSMRAATERVGPCTPCHGTGSALCGKCDGSSRVRCSRCWGTGKQKSENTGRPINCKLCKKTGTVDCTSCHQGKVPCGTCGSTGQELVWMTFAETTRWDIALDPDGPVAKAYPFLRKATPLEPRECAGLEIVTTLEAQGPLAATQLGALSAEDRAFVETRGRVHPRFERVAFQQMMRLEVVRRDVTFEMCGTSGTLVLSGDPLLGATTDEAKKPLRNRLVAWTLIMMGLFLVSAAFRSVLVGTSKYFDSVRPSVTLFWLGSVVAVAPAISGMLRSWRGGLRRWSMRPSERWLGATGVALFFAMWVFALVAQPKSEDVGVALRAGNVELARLTLEALQETRSTLPNLAALEDDVLLAEAEQAQSTRRLSLLEQVATRSGPRAGEGKARLDTARLQELRSLTTAKHGDQALSAAKRWYPSEATRPAEVLVAMGEAADAVAASCGNAPCRLSAQRASFQYSPTPTRRAALEVTRTQLLTALVVPSQAVSPSQLAGRLRELRALSELATQTTAAVLPEDELGKRAEAVLAQASALRLSVPLIGASQDVVEELLGGLTKKDELIWTAQREGLQLFALFDRNARCRGLYAAGLLANRVIALDKAAALLTQAVGGAAQLRVPQSAQSSMVKWNAGGVRVQVRGRAGELYELRIGAADP